LAAGLVGMARTAAVSIEDALLRADTLAKIAHAEAAAGDQAAVQKTLAAALEALPPGQERGRAMVLATIAGVQAAIGQQSAAKKSVREAMKAAGGSGERDAVLGWIVDRLL